LKNFNLATVKEKRKLEKQAKISSLENSTNMKTLVIPKKEVHQ
jgi:hypothetical protein